MDHPVFAPAALRAGRVLRGVEDGLLVVVDGEEKARHCLVLETGAALRFAVDDRVLVAEIAGETSAVVVGRIGRGAQSPVSEDTVPDQLLLEARHELTLRVGEGSITIREDGRILIKGKDLVSHAQRMNRIKGGAVSIN